MCKHKSFLLHIHMRTEIESDLHFVALKCESYSLKWAVKSLTATNNKLQHAACHSRHLSYSQVIKYHSSAVPFPPFSPHVCVCAAQWPLTCKSVMHPRQMAGKFNGLGFIKRCHFYGVDRHKHSPRPNAPTALLITLTRPTVPIRLTTAEMLRPF